MTYTKAELRLQLNDYAHRHDLMLNRCRDTYLSEDAVILEGKFSGRLARITGVMLQDGRVLLLAQPYRLKGGAVCSELLWSHPAARSYRPLSELSFAPHRTRRMKNGS